MEKSYGINFGVHFRAIHGVRRPENLIKMPIFEYQTGIYTQFDIQVRATPRLLFAFGMHFWWKHVHLDGPTKFG